MHRIYNISILYIQQGVEMGLEKKLSFTGVFSIATGAMISSGIFILPGLAFTKAGPAVFISYTLAGILGLLGILSVIELSTAMPKAGGDYFFINKTFGPMFGSISGFLGWIALSLKSAFAIFGLSEIIYIYSGINIIVSALFFCVFFVILNIRGVQEAALFQTILVAALLTLMIVFIVLGIPQINPSHFSPLLNNNFNDIVITSGFIFISFGGLLNVANLSEEMINPKKNIPLGMITSIVTVTILYGLITFVLTGTLDPAAFKKSLTPVADSGRLIIGDMGYVIIVVASILAFFTTANAGIMSASRYPMALSRDMLLPNRIGRVNKNNTPTTAIILTGIIIFISLLLPLEYLVKSASTVILTSYVLTNISVIIMRESKITNYKPSFKSPFYPFLQIACVLLFSFFIIDMGKDAIEISLGFIFISFCIYVFYGRKIKKRESALFYLVARITGNELNDQKIEDELREILINRDNIEQDNFDRLVKDADFVEIEENLNFRELLDRIVPAISSRVEMPENKIIDRFLERQDSSNTAVSGFLAIPHIVLEGTEKTFLTVIRARKGIHFTDKEDSVKAVFLLGATEDRKILHLKTIASIATLVQHRDFEEKWENLENTLELKNLMLLSKRKRFH